MNNDLFITAARNYLCNTHRCHTIILYGSFAHDQATETSDIDVIGIRDQGEFERDCHQIEGHYLDAFIYQSDAIKDPDPYLIRIRGGVVLCQKGDIGDKLLKKINNLYHAGPAPTPAWEQHEIITWLGKMTNRAAQADIDGNFRRHWLLHDALECYFKLRNLWYLGPKESFAWLNNNDISIYQLFEDALKPSASIEDIKALVKAINSQGESND